MQRQKFDGWLAAMGAIIGILFGLLFAVTFFLDSNHYDWNPVQITGYHQEPPQPGVNAEMRVEVFCIWGYTRTAPRWEDFETERQAWFLAAPFAVVILGAIAGWWVGIVIGRRARRRTARQVP